MLQQVLESERLINLKGVALEVDTKPIPEIVSEFRSFRNRFGPSFDRILQFATSENLLNPMTGERTVDHLEPVTDDEKTKLFDEYQRYALVMTGQLQPSGLSSGRKPNSTLQIWRIIDRCTCRTRSFIGAGSWSTCLHARIDC